MSRTSPQGPKPEFELPEGGGEGLEPTEVHDVLSNKRRVAVIRLLCQDDRYEVSELAEELAAIETDERPPPRNKRQSAYVSLHQTHLPRLDEVGIVDYDARRKAVTLNRQEFAAFTDAIDAATPEERAAPTEDPSNAWLDATIAMTVIGLCLSVASYVAPPPFLLSPAWIVATATLVAVLVVLVYRKGQTNTPWFESLRDRTD